MRPDETYKKILSELEIEMDDLERRVFRALRRHPQGLTRTQLIAIVYRTSADENISNDTRDRKIREAISSLREKRVPILSHSGQAGYRLDGSRESKAAMLNDLRSRRENLSTLILQVQNFLEIPDELPEAPVQERLF